MSINSLSKRLNEVTSLFMSVFDLRRKEMRKNNFLQQRHLMNSYAHSQSIKQEMSIDLFSTKNSCVINISLLNSLGQIKECTRSIQKIFLMTQKEIVGQNVSLLMPTSIAEVHNQILQQYIKNGSYFNQQSEKKYFFLGQDRLGQIIPLKAQMQLHVKDDDFGVVAFLSKVNSTNHYILFQKHSHTSQCQISNISKGMNAFFVPSIATSQAGRNNLKNVCLEKLIPVMSFFDGIVSNEVQENEKNFWMKEQSTLFFYPKNQQQLNFVQKSKNKQKYYDTQTYQQLMVALMGDDFGLLEVRFIVNQFYQNNYYLEITSIRQVKRSIERNESVGILASQLNSFKKSTLIELDLGRLKKVIDVIKSQQSVSFLDMPDDWKINSYSNSSLANIQGSYIKNDSIPVQSGSLNNFDSQQSNPRQEERSHDIIQNHQDDSKVSQPFKMQFQSVSKEMFVIEEDQQESNKYRKTKIQQIQEQEGNYSFTRQINQNQTNLDDIKFHNDYDNQDESVYQIDTTARKNNITQRELLHAQSSATNRELNNQLMVEPPQKSVKKDLLNTSHLGVTQNLSVSLMNNFEDMNDINRHNKFEEINNENNKSIMDLSSINLMKQQHDTTIQGYNQEALKGQINNSHLNNFNSYTIANLDSYAQPQRSVQNVVSDLKKIDKQLNQVSTLNSQLNKQASISTQVQDGIYSNQLSNNQLDPKSYSTNSFLQNDNPNQKQSRNYPMLIVNNNQKKEEDDEEDNDQQDGREQTEKFQSEKDVSNKASSMTNNFQMNVGFENINPDALVDQSNSSKTRTELSSTKRRIAYIITSKRQNALIKTINYFGYLALLLLTFITLFVFFTLKSNFSTMIDNLQQIPRGSDLMQSSSSVILNRELIRADQYGAFYVDLNDVQQQHFKDSYKSALNDFRDQINDLSTVGNGFKFMQYVNNDQIEIQETTDTGNIAQLKNLTIIYALPNIYYNLHEYITSDEQQNRGYVLRNYVLFQEVYQQIRQLSQDEAMQSNEEVQSILQWTYILIELVSALNIFMILPIYYKVQQYREEILKLFATFPKEKLMGMINYMNRIINSRFYKSHSSGQLSSGRLSSNNFYKNNVFKPNSHIKWKNKVISQTTNLKKFHMGIFISCVFMLALISIYPTVNYSVCQPYLDQFITFFNEFIIIQKVKSQICFVYAISFTRLTCAIENKPILSDQLDQHYNQDIIPENKNILDQLSSIPSDFQRINRFNEHNQELILLNPLQSSLCDFMKNLKASSLYDVNVHPVPEEFSICETVYEGQLTKGLILTVKQLLDVLMDLYSIAIKGVGPDAIKEFENWDKYNKIAEFDEISDLTLEFLDVISKYLFVEYTKLFNILNLVQYVLLSYSLFILLMAFFFGWRLFIDYSNQQIIETKIILSVLNIDHIVDNSYIFSYFKKQFGQSF